MSISFHTKPRKSVCRERKGKQMQEGIGRGDTGVLKRSRHGEAVFLAREALLDPGLCPASFERPFCSRKRLLFYLTSSFCLRLFWVDFVPLATKEPCKRNTFCPLPNFFFLPNLLESVNLSFSWGEGKGGYLLVSSCVSSLSLAHDLVGEQLVLPHCPDWQSKVQRG